MLNVLLRPRVARPTRRKVKPALVCRRVRTTPAHAAPHAGYGACTKCNCRGYEGNTYTCANGGCGHAYGDHW